MLLYAIGNNCNLKYKLSVISTGGDKVTDTADTILDLWKEMLKSNFSLKVVKRKDVIFFPFKFTGFLDPRLIILALY